MNHPKIYRIVRALALVFALFGADDAMVMCNSRFCRQMPKVWPELNEGIGFVDYVRLVAEKG